MKCAEITGIILAGGRSSRLGGSKLLVRIDGAPLLNRVLDTLSQLTSSIVVVTSDDLPGFAGDSVKGMRVVKDIYPGKGPLGGIYTGLMNSQTGYNLVVGCDMPFLNRKLIDYLVGCAPGFAAVAPKMGWMIQPLHAVYSKSCLPAIETLIGEGQLQIIKLFGMVKTRYVTEEEIDRFDPDRISFLNINTGDDLLKAQMLTGKAEKLA